MKIEQIYTGCLAEAAYYIESDGEAAIIDPLREVDPYLEMAAANNANIKFVLETHFHADFVSGHLDLANKTGAAIVYGPTAKPNFEAYIAEHGEELKLGKLTIKVLHTPGHTMESSCFLLIDQYGVPQALFTGDTLFIGDVGRPDLAVKSDLSREDLAGFLFDSLRDKIMTFPDDIIIYPGHGAGSACGKNMSKKTSDTLGRQRLFNYALAPKMSREEFIKQVTTGLVQPPQYFPKNASINKQGYESIDHILRRGLSPLYPNQFDELQSRHQALILDTRPPARYLESHIPQSLWVGIDDNFAPWIGALIEDLDREIVFISEPRREEEVVTRLARVGYDHALGYLEGGLEAWKSSGRKTASIKSIGPHDFVGLYDTQLLHVLDVRKTTEYDSQHVEGVVNFPLDQIYQNMQNLNSDHHYYVHCQGGYRSVIACSILSNRGFRVLNIEGGLNEIKKSCVQVTDFKEPVSML
jgi:hydroxyacylglutathione hydrolase